MTTIWVIIALVSSAQCSSWLFTVGYKRNVRKFDYLQVVLFPCTGIYFGILAFLVHGFDLNTAQLGFHILLISVVFFVLIGLPVLAYSTVERLLNKPKQLAFSFLGFWHAILQLATPYVLSAYGSTPSVLAMLLAIPFVNLLAYILAKKSSALSKWLLLVVWIFIGVGMVSLPYFIPGKPINGWFIPFLGFLFTCFWFGWYLLVAGVFNGHNNEIGGAARIEDYKQIIRIRLRENDLTVFVVGFEKVEDDVQKLKPALIDIFQLKC